MSLLFITFAKAYFKKNAKSGGFFREGTLLYFGSNLSSVASPLAVLRLTKLLISFTRLFQ